MFNDNSPQEMFPPCPPESPAQLAGDNIEVTKD